MIPPGDRRKIAAFLRILWNQRESKKVGFEISTDSSELPSISFVLSATAWPEWEVQHLSDGPPTLLVGQPSRQVIQIVSRRIGEEGVSGPTGIRAEPPLTARFAGEPREDRGPGDLVSITRDVEVQLPPSASPGARSASVIFSWAGDLNRTSAVPWNVVRPLQVTPTSLAIKSSELASRQTVEVRAFDKTPFRIISIGPRELVKDASFDSEPRPSQTVTFNLATDGLERATPRVVCIQTDRADEPAASVDVFLLKMKD